MNDERAIAHPTMLEIPSSLIGPVLINRSYAFRIGAGIFCVLVFAALRYALIPLLGDQAPFMPLVLAVFTAAILGGLSVGIVATLLSCVLAIGVLTPWPTDKQLLASIAHTTYFLLISCIICGIVHRLQLASRLERELLADAKTAEKKLSLAQQRLSIALRAGRSGTFDWDIRNSVNTWSKELLQLYGFAETDAVVTRETCVNSVHPDDLKLVEETAENALRQGRGLVDFRICRQDTGEIRWMHGRGIVLFDENEQPERMIGVSVDITERKQMENALRDSERTLKLIYDNASDCLFLANIIDRDIVDQEKIIFLSVNEAFLRVTGFKREQVESHFMEEIIPAANQALTRTKYLEAIRTGKKIVYEEIAELPAGRRHGEITLVPIAANDGSFNLVLTAVRDITATKEAEAALHNEASRKDEFLAMLAHELRNPLAPIHNIAHLLSTTQFDAQRVTQYSSILQRQTRQLMRLVDDLLDVSRITRGKIALQKEYAALDSILEGALETMRPILDTKQQSVTIARDPMPLMLTGDPARLNQVFVNLLSNAAKYSEHHSKINIVVKHAGEFAVVHVQDEGIGIDAAMLPRIFDLFMQAEQSLDRAHGGLGVGLTIVKRLIEMHGGRIEARSAGYGHGSEFIVHLPIAHESNNVQAIKRLNSADVISQKILIVDDNADAADSIALVLRIADHEVVVANDGLAALDALKTFTATIALLDIGLPGLDGYALAQMIRKQYSDRTMKLFALTGYGAQEDKALALAAGFDAHFTKPVDPDLLMSVIDGN